MSHRKSLSVVIITYNEAELLPDCLASVTWADEIVVLDAGSRDATRYIAAEAGARVYHTEDWLGFGIQRQRAQDYANGDYIFMLDADERITTTLQTSIKKILRRSDMKSVYSCTRRNIFLGRFMRYGGWYPDKVVRLYARNYYRYNSLSVHESLKINGATIVDLSGDLYHLTCCNLISFQRKQLQYAEAWAKERYLNKQKCNVLTIINHTYFSFLKSWILNIGFLDGKLGWLLAIINTQYTFNKYAILWSLNYLKKKRSFCDK